MIQIPQQVDICSTMRSKNPFSDLSRETYSAGKQTDLDQLYLDTSSLRNSNESIPTQSSISPKSTFFNHNQIRYDNNQILVEN